MIKDNTTPQQQPQEDRKNEVATKLVEMLFVAVLLFIFGIGAKYIGALYGTNFLIGMCTGTVAYLFIRPKGKND